MGKIINKNIFFILMITISSPFFSCKEGQSTEPDSGIATLTVPGQTLTGMIVHTNNG